MAHEAKCNQTYSRKLPEDMIDFDHLTPCVVVRPQDIYQTYDIQV